MTGSIQSRLIAGTILGVAAVLAVSGSLLDLLVRTALLGEFDRSLAAKVRLLASLVEQEGERLEIEFDPDRTAEFLPRAGCEYFQIWSSTGRVLERSASLGDADLARFDDHANGPGDSGCRPVVLPDGRAGRQFHLTFQPRWADDEERSASSGPPAPPPVTLAVARDTLDLGRTLRHLRFLLIGVGGAATALAAALMAGVVRGGLGPLRRLAEQIARLKETDLSERIVLHPAPAELGPVVDRLNDLLHRLESAFAREKAFAADAAHELRTPLAGLRSTLEVTLSRSRDELGYRAALTDALAIVRQMQHMADTLLALTRIESGQVKVSRERIDLPSMLRECWRPLAGRAEQRRLRIAWDLRPATPLGDRETLRQALSNILDNAVTYADEGGAIQVQTQESAGVTCLTVSNTGCTLSPEQIQHVFERFWRGDSARQDVAHHCGLGLALCRRILDLQGGRITAECAGGVFKVSVSLAAAS
ncbi:MAG: HAMP domain-containing protein [Phycisphaerae bacterium]